MMLLKKIGAGRIMILFKILKYIILIIILSIIIIFITDTKPMDVIKYLTDLSIKQKGLTMQTTKWKEFDFTDIAGEEQAVIFGGLTKAEALLNYRIYTFYSFDGEVGFVGGSDYDKQDRIYFDSLNDGDDVDIDAPHKQETAYIFKTNNDGKTFSKHALGRGFVAEIIKYNKNYYAFVEDYSKNTKTFISKDKGKSWNLYYPAAIEAFFSEHRFIFSEPSGIQTVQSVLRFNYFYTKDGGKTSVPLSDKIMNYAKNMHPKYQRNFRLIFNIYDGKLLFIEDESLITLDIDTQKEDRTVLKFPEGYKLASYASREYGKNLLESHKTRDRNLNTLQINKENGKPYIILQKDNTKDTVPEQISIWYPFEDNHIVFDKKVSKNIPLKVSGDYIGGFIKKNGILIHTWTLNNGKTWEYELLPDYYLLVGPKVIYNNVWMTAIVRGDRPDGKEGYPKVKGSYLIMGKLNPIDSDKKQNR